MRTGDPARGSSRGVGTAEMIVKAPKLDFSHF
jgi:hypothetical protein